MTTSMHRLIRTGSFVMAAMMAVAVLVACGQPDPTLTKSVSAGARPDGRILFAQNGDIYMWDGKVHQITNVGDASSPSWSSDGKRFVFVRTGDSYSDLYSYDTVTDKMVRLTNNKPRLQEGTQAYVDNAVWALDPNWSPNSANGDTIVYVSDLQTAKDFLWIMHGLGSSPRQIGASTTNGDNVENPCFSPDGTRIVFTQRVTRQNDLQRTTSLFVVDLNSGKLSPLVKADSGAYDPTWSPDGKWVAFIERDGTNNDLWVVPADGGQPTQLTQGKSLASPVWSPDSSEIAFFEVDGESFKVSYVDFSVDASGAPSASPVQKLFSAGNIDATSAMSWVP